MAAASEYVLEPIRDRAEFTLYRGPQRGNPMPLLVVAPTEEQPLPQSLRRLEHEYSLAAELEPRVGGQAPGSYGSRRTDSPGSRRPGRGASRPRY
jgi:hypothetical protein